MTSKGKNKWHSDIKIHFKEKNSKVKQTFCFEWQREEDFSTKTKVKFISTFNRKPGLTRLFNQKKNKKALLGAEIN